MMAWEKIQPYHEDMAEYLNPPTAPKLLIAKLFTFGIASGLANGFVGYGIYSAFSGDYLIIMGIVFSLLGLFVQHTLFNNVAKIARRNMRRSEEKQLSINPIENKIIRSINVFCAIMTIFTAMQVAGNKIEWKQQQAEIIATEINNISAEKDSTLARFDRNIKRYQELDKITYYAIPEQLRRQAYLDSVNHIINTKATEYASLKTNIVNTKDYTEVFKFLSGGFKWLSIVFTLIAGSLFYVVIDSGYVSDAETYSQYKYAKYLAEKENHINQKQEKQATAKPDEPTIINRDEEDSIQLIVERLKAKKAGDNVVFIAKYLLGTTLTYDEIGKRAADDLNRNKPYTTSWVEKVNKALKRMGENAR